MSRTLFRVVPFLNGKRERVFVVEERLFWFVWTASLPGPNGLTRTFHTAEDADAAIHDERTKRTAEEAHLKRKPWVRP